MQTEIQIGGTTFPLRSITVTREPIWSSNTGRSADGTMIGDIVAHKMKLEVGFPILTDAQAATLDTLIRSAFFQVKFHNPGTNTDETKTMYAGSAAYPVYSYASGLPRYVGMNLSLVEK